MHVRSQGVEPQHAESVSVWLGALAGPLQAQLDNFKARALRAGATEAWPRHLYVTAWVYLAGNSPGSQVVEALLLGPGWVRCASRSPPGHTSYRLCSPSPAVLVFAPGANLGGPSLPMTEETLCLLIALVQAAPASAAPATWLLSVRAQLSAGLETKADPIAAGPWGLGRSARMEAPATRVGCIDLGSAHECERQPAVWRCMLACMDGGAPAELELSSVQVSAHVPRLAAAPPPSRTSQTAAAPVCAPGDFQLLTGGTGGLGLLTARWLVQQGAHGVVLASRTAVLPVGGDSSAAVEYVRLTISGTRVLAERCDAADASEARRLLSAVWFTLSAAVGGLWHAAGVLADGVLTQQRAASLRHVYGPKALGAVTLLHACAMSVLRSCALFSSVAALLGSAGQANYAAANSCLDSHAVWRRVGGTACVSAQWGAWAEVGMAAGGAVHERLQASGFDLIGLAEGLASLHAATAPQGASVLAVVPARWHVLLGGADVVPALLSAIAPQRSLRASKQGIATGAIPCVGLEAVLGIVRRTAGGLVDADAPLIGVGIDSLGAVELRNLVQETVGEGMSLPTTIVFDHPTTRHLTAALQLTPKAAAPSADAPSSAVASATSDAIDLRAGSPSLPVSTHQEFLLLNSMLLTTYYLLLTTYYLLLTTHYLLLTTRYLPLTTYYSLLTTYY